MNKEIGKKWVEALRSGKYLQGKTALRRYDRFCCLGVLCEVLGLENRTRGDGFTEYLSSSPHEPRSWQHVVLTEGMKYKVGLTHFEAAKLMDMNDDKCNTFSEIADYIEQNILLEE